jgi:hypothetical protein
VELLGDGDRFVFHRAAEMPAALAGRWVDEVRGQIVARATRVLGRLARERSARCAVVAKPGVLLPLDQVLSSHPRIHAAEGLFYRDAMYAAAQAAGLAALVVEPRELDVKDARLAARLAAVGRALGKPWTADWKLATVAAWGALARSP